MVTSVRKNVEIEEIDLYELLNKHSITLSELFPKYSCFDIFVQAFRDYIIKRDGVIDEGKFEYMKSLRNLGYVKDFHEYFQSHGGYFLRFGEYSGDDEHLFSFADSFYEELTKDYLSGSDSRVEDLTVVNGVKKYKLKINDVTELIAINHEIELFDAVEKAI